MLESLRNRAEMRRKAGEIYGVVVTQARSPEFYAALGVPDTPSGRYEMVTLHLFLVHESLRERAGEAPALARMLTEAFVEDMDDSLRELGTGDLSVPKKVRRAAAGLYDRSMAYRAPLEAADTPALAACLAEHVYAGTAHPGAQSLARYALAASALLARIDLVDAPTALWRFPAVPNSAGEAA